MQFQNMPIHPKSPCRPYIYVKRDFGKNLTEAINVAKRRKN